MRKSVLSFVLVAACCAPAFGEEECKLERFGVVPYETDGSAHIYIPVKLAGRSTRLLLDTGAYWSGIRKDLVEELGLPTKKSYLLEMRDLAGDKVDQITNVPELKISNLNLGANDFFVMGTAGLRTIDEEGGFMGLNLLAFVDLEIDPAAKTISFFNQNHCPGDGVHWADEAVTLTYKRRPADTPLGTRLKQKVDKNQIDYPIVRAELEGQPVTVLFDTGATSTAIDLDYAKRLGVTISSPGVAPAGKVYAASGGAVDAYTYTFKSLNIAGIQFENVPVRLADFKNSAEVILGMNELKKLHIYFSFKEGLIHVTGADAKRAP